MAAPDFWGHAWNSNAGAIDIATINVIVNVDFDTNDPLATIAFDTTDKEWTIPTGGAGLYEVVFTQSGFGVADKYYIWHVMVNDSEDEYPAPYTKERSGDTQNAMLTHFVTLSEGDTVAIGIENISDGQDYTTLDGAHAFLRRIDS